MLNTTQAAVKITGANKTFAAKDSSAADYCALSGLDLEVRQGEFFCLLGPSGCGKTTLLNLVAGFEQPTRGEVVVEGERVMAPSQYRGVVFQTDRALFEWLTVEENIGFGPKMRGIDKAEARRNVEQKLELVGLTQHRTKLPRELSGGMKQRVQIARILANDPRILLMDEPFAALDAYTRGLMQRELARIWQATGITVVFVTHDVAEALWLADRIGVMTQGPSSRISTIVDVPLPRPRERMTDGFIELFNDLTDYVNAAASKNFSGRDSHVSGKDSYGGN